MSLDLFKNKEVAIGGVNYSPPLVLAPMSGVTNSAYRRLLRHLNGSALGLVVTEFISIEGLSRGIGKSVGMMKFYPVERPLAIQIFGHQIARMVDSAKLAEEHGADILDINCGCPVPKVVKRGGGCNLMREQDHLRELLTATRKALKIPLTLKFRAGWDQDSRNAVEIAKIAEECGCDLVTVHGRTRADGYRGFADWNLIGEVVEAVKIPVLGSGDVVDLKSAKERFKSGVKGLMVGRAALTNPWIFSEIYQEHAPIVRTKQEIYDVMYLYQELLLEDLPERGAIGKLKQMASQITRLIPGSAEARKLLTRAKTTAEFNQVAEQWVAGEIISNNSLNSDIGNSDIGNSEHDENPNELTNLN